MARASLNLAWLFSEESLSELPHLSPDPLNFLPSKQQAGGRILTRSKVETLYCADQKLENSCCCRFFYHLSFPFCLPHPSSPPVFFFVNLPDYPNKLIDWSCRPMVSTHADSMHEKANRCLVLALKHKLKQMLVDLHGDSSYYCCCEFLSDQWKINKQSASTSSHQRKHQELEYLISSMFYIQMGFICLKCK